MRNKTRSVIELCISGGDTKLLNLVAYKFARANM